MSNSLILLAESLFSLSEDTLWVKGDIFGFVEQLKEELSIARVGSCNSTQNGTNVIVHSVVSPSAFVGSYSVVRNSIIQSGARIGAHVEVAYSIVLEGAVIPHHNYIGRSIVGREVTLGGNTRTAVRRLDDRNPRIELPSFGIVHSRTPKIGAFIGDGSKIGSSVVLNPMTVIGKNVVVDPGLILTGYYPEGSRIKNPQIMKPRSHETSNQ